MPLDNPAGRLLAAFNLAKQQRHDESALKGWCTVWGLDHETFEGRATCFRRSSEAMALGMQIRQEAEALLETNVAIAGLLECLPQIESALGFFQTLPNATLGQMFTQVQPDGWLALKTLDAILSAELTRPSISDEDRLALIDQTRLLVDAVLADSTLSEDVKRQILESLRDVESALIEYELTGSESVNKAANGLAGSLLRLYLKGERVAKHPISQAVLGLVFAIDVLLNGGANYKELTTNPVVKVFVEDPAGITPPMLPSLAPSAIPTAKEGEPKNGKEP